MPTPTSQSRALPAFETCDSEHARNAEEGLPGDLTRRSVDFDFEGVALEYRTDSLDERRLLDICAFEYNAKTPTRIPHLYCNCVAGAKASHHTLDTSPRSVHPQLRFEDLSHSGERHAIQHSHGARNGCSLADLALAVNQKRRLDTERIDIVTAAAARTSATNSE